MFHEVGITVREILELPEFSGVVVAGGCGGLDRVVTNINVMEVPDILDWVREGDMLLTTGYAIKDNLDAQRMLLPTLAGKGLAVLGMKPKRYIDAIPPHMIEAANELNVPLLELPREVNFSDLISAVLAELVNRQSRFVQLSLIAHRRFINLLLEGGGLQEISRAAADLLQAVISIEDSLNLRRVVSGMCWGPPNEALITELLDRPMEFLEPETFTDRVEGTVLWFKRNQVETNGYKAEIIRAPVTAANEQFGSLTAVKFSGQFDVTDLYSLERLCPLIALDIIRCHDLTQVEQKYRTEFLDQLFSSDNPDEERFLERATTFGWDLRLDYVTILFDVLPSKPISDIAEYENACQMVKTQATTILSDFCRRNNLRHILTRHASGILLFVHPEEVAPDDTVSWANRLLKKARSNLRRWTVSSGISRRVSGVTGIKRGFREAKAALDLGKVIFGKGQDIHYEMLGIYGLLLGQADLDEQKRFADEIVGSLRDYDTAKGGELLPTLEVYFATNGNARKTARLMYAHYNTILYRLKKIKELTGLDPNHADQRLSLQTALRLSTIFDMGHHLNQSL
ncbi:MAG TPA: PucR family transcriptional regulator ligand-binding domain-containing protein [Bacillota bacterium]|nr:PucR family transcriptional regulator ligand-binding domain-containing protein [Bacillota bacterium]